MICPHCKQAELDIYNEEFDDPDSIQLTVHYWYWCPNCYYRAMHKVWYNETKREMVWEESE